MSTSPYFTNIIVLTQEVNYYIFLDMTSLNRKRKRNVYLHYNNFIQLYKCISFLWLIWQNLIKRTKCADYLGHKQKHPSGHMTFKQRRLNVDATSWRCIDVEATLYKREVPAGIYYFHICFQCWLRPRCQIWVLAGYRANIQVVNVSKLQQQKGNILRRFNLVCARIHLLWPKFVHFAVIRPRSWETQRRAWSDCVCALQSESTLFALWIKGVFTMYLHQCRLGKNCNVMLKSIFSWNMGSTHPSQKPNQ